MKTITALLIGVSLIVSIFSISFMAISVKEHLRDSLFCESCWLKENLYDY